MIPSACAFYQPVRLPHSTMPGGNAGDNVMVMSDKLSGIEEESDMYDAFAPHVDTSQIAVLTDSPAGKLYQRRDNRICVASISL